MSERCKASVRYSHLLAGGRYERRDDSCVVVFSFESPNFKIVAKDEDANARLWTVRETNFERAIKIYRHKELVSE